MKFTEEILLKLLPSEAETRCNDLRITKTKIMHSDILVLIQRNSRHKDLKQRLK
jgi:hypothetical protein